MSPPKVPACVELGALAVKLLALPVALPAAAGRRLAHARALKFGWLRSRLHRVGAILSGGRATAAPGGDPADHFDNGAEHDHRGKCQQQACPWPVCERLAAEPAEEECVARPDNSSACRSRDKAIPAVSHQSAGHRHSGSAARDEPAGQDQAGAEPVQARLRAPASPAKNRRSATRPKRRSRHVRPVESRWSRL